MQLRWVVEETLFYDLLMFPSLIRKLINREAFAVESGELKHPVNGDAIAFNCEKINWMREHVTVSRERSAFAGNEHVAAYARRVMVLLHGRGQRLEALDGFGVLTADDSGDEGFDGGLSWHSVVG